MAAQCVLIFHSCAIFSFFSRVLLKVFGLFCAILDIFANFVQFWAFFVHILRANFSESKFCVCYFVSFFHLWSQHTHLTKVGNFFLGGGRLLQNEYSITFFGREVFFK